jgi:HAMP domain-containing protein
VKLLAKFNLILLVIFGAGGILISQISYSFLISNARREVLADASATSVREYTATDLSPLLEQNPRHRVRFLPETIPFYGATVTLNNLRKSNPDYAAYTYKEAALNPTNLEDRAADWQRDIIDEMRNHPEHPQIINERSTDAGSSLYIANAIKVTPDCLLCHGNPKSAPPAMLAVYGSANGFGWKPNEIVGAQIISVPMTVPLQIANRAYRSLLLYLILTLLVTIAALDAGVYWFVIHPLRLVSDTANKVSRGEKNVPALPIHGKDEIATVAGSFNRMKLSLEKAMKMMDDN